MQLTKGPDGKRAAVLKDVGVPKLQRGDLLVKMMACGICGTDIEKIRGEYTAAMPTLGHEAVGTIEEVGKDVVGFEPGERVFPHHHVSCGKCYYCRAGSLTMCNEYRTSNLDPGGFSELFRVPKINLTKGGVLRIPPKMGFELASLIEPLACCLRASDRCGVKPDESVLIVGAGPVGMTHALLLGSLRAKVFLSDVSKSRLEFARRSGFENALDASAEDVAKEVWHRTGGRGVDLSIVAAGSPVAVVQALRSTRKGGRVCLFGIPLVGSSLDYDLSDIYNSEISIVPSYGATEHDTKRAMGLLAAKRIDFGRLVTRRYPLESFERALESASEGSEMKVIVTS